MAHDPEWKAKIQGILNPPDGPRDDPRVAALQAFVAELNAGPWVHAHLREVQLPFGYTLVTAPRSRRDITSLMQTFWAYRDGLRVAGGGEVLRTPEDVTNHLVHFVTESEFPFTIEEYKRICQSESDGVLRSEASQADIWVSPEAQMRLADFARRADPASFALDCRSAQPEQNLVALVPSTIRSGGFSFSALAAADVGAPWTRFTGKATP